MAKKSPAVTKLIEDSQRNAAILEELKGPTEIVCLRCLLESMRDYFQFQIKLQEDNLGEHSEYMDYILLNIEHQLKRLAPHHS